VFGFLGPNGSGKTTTIRLLLGLLEPSQGRSEVLGYGTSTQSDQIRQKCGAILEHHGLYERLSAEDNLEFYGRVWHISASDRQARITDFQHRLLRFIHSPFSGPDVTRDVENKDDDFFSGVEL